MESTTGAVEWTRERGGEVMTPGAGSIGGQTPQDEEVWVKKGETHSQKVRNQLQSLHNQFPNPPPAFRLRWLSRRRSDGRVWR